MGARQQQDHREGSPESLCPATGHLPWDRDFSLLSPRSSRGRAHMAMGKWILVAPKSVATAVPPAPPSSVLRVWSC